MWLWIGLSMGATFEIDRQDDGGLRMVVEPGEGWEITPEPGLGMQVHFAKEGGGHMKVEALAVTLPPAVSPEKLKYVRLTTHYTACDKASGLCKPFELMGEVRVKKGSGRAELSPMLDATEHHAAFEVGPAERKVDPAFEAADTAYFGAIDGGTPSAWEAFRAEQLQEQRVHVGVFGFEGCGPCKSLAREVLFSDDASLPVPWMLVNSMHPDAGRRYLDHGVEGAPVVLVFDGKGEVVDRLVGYADGKPGPLRKLLEHASNR